MRPSFRLRILNFALRFLVKPMLTRSGDPERAQRSFERTARWVFSTPKGVNVIDDGPCARVTHGAHNPDQAVLYLHGGAFIAGSRHSYRAMAGRIAKRTGATVFIADYPKLQDAPFPAAPNTARAAWDHLLAQGWFPHQIIIAGDSAGGNLVFGLLSQILKQGQKPAGVLAFSPWTDLTMSGESIQTNAKSDPFLPVNRMAEVTELYLNGADAKHPLASPLFADFTNPPPVFIQAGAQEALLSDAKRMAEKLNGTLDVWENVPHVWQIFDGRLPEANAAMRRAAGFVQTSFANAKR